MTVKHCRPFHYRVLCACVLAVACWLLFVPARARAALIGEEERACESVLRVEDVETSLAHMRGLETSYEIPCFRIGSGLASEMLMMDFRANNSEEKLKVLGQIYTKLTDTEAEYTEDDIRPYFVFVGGFYNPMSKNVFIVEIDPFTQMLRNIAKGEKPKKNLDFNDIEKMMKAKPDYREEEFVLIHEYTHAVQDEYFDLMELHGRAQGNSDIRLALDAMIEGEASWLAFEYEAHVKKIGQSNYRDITEVLDDLQQEWRKNDQDNEDNKFGEMLGSMVAFPYVQGMGFMQHARRTFGFEHDSEIFMDPPLSSEQVLHPEKYFEERDMPVAVDLAPVLAYFDGLDNKDVKVVHEDTLGEFGIRSIFDVLLPAGEAMDAAQGWDGDRFLGFLDKREDAQIIWFSVWDTDEEADEFLRIFKKYALEKNLRLRKTGQAGEQGDLYKTSYGVIYLERRGNQVAIIDEFTMDTDIEELISAIWESGREEVSPWIRGQVTDPEEREAVLDQGIVASYMKKAGMLAEQGYGPAAINLLDTLYNNGYLEGQDLYDAAIIYGMSGDCEFATGLYEEFLEDEDNPDRRTELHAALVAARLKSGDGQAALDALAAFRGELGGDTYETVKQLSNARFSLKQADDDAAAALLRDFAETRLNENDAFGAAVALDEARDRAKDEALKTEISSRTDQVNESISGAAKRLGKKYEFEFGKSDDIAQGDILVLISGGEPFARMKVESVKPDSCKARILSMAPGFEPDDFEELEVESGQAVSPSD